MKMHDILEAFKSCKKPLSDKSYGEKIYPYYKYKCYIEALDEIVGAENVAIQYSPIQFAKILSGQEMFYLSCTVTITDETGQSLARTGYGGREVYLNSSGKDVNLANLPESVQKIAFKNACKMFGLLVPPRSSGANDITSEPTSNTSSERKASDKLRLSFITEGTFFQCSEQNGKAVYKVQAHIIEGECMRAELSEIIFYPNRTAKCIQKMNSFIAKSQTSSVKLRMEVSRSGLRNNMEQYVFYAFI